MSVTIYYSSHFEKRARKYKHLSSRISKQIEIFQNNPHDPRLKTHKLAGSLKGYWSFSVDRNLRIMFEFLSKDSVAFVDVGTHQIYK